MEKIFVVTMLLLVSCSNSLAQDHNANANNTEGYNPCDGIHELFPDPEDCGKFYHCDGLTPYHKDCPAELEWSVARNRCEWPWIAGCSGTPTSRPGPRPTRQPGPSPTSSEGPQPAPTSGPAPGYNPCDGIHEFFPDPEDCGKFYHCDGLTPYHKDCPAGLDWSVKRNRCEWPWIAGCSGPPTPQPGPKPTGQPEPSPTFSDGPQPAPTSGPGPAPGYNPCDGVHEFFPDPEDCSKFYHCNGFIPYHMDCPAGLDWSVKRNRCEWPRIAGCSGSSTPQPRPRTTGQPEPSPTSSKVPQPTPTSGPEPTPTSGPEPTPTSGPEPTPTSGPEPTPTSGPEPTSRTTGQNEPSPTSSKGPQPTPTTGPQPASTEGPQPSPTSAPGYNPCDGVHEFFPDPEDCGKFYQCNGFIPYHMNCPAGLEWSVTRNRCEWPWNAGCSGSFTPQPGPRPTGQPQPSPTSSDGPKPVPTLEPRYNPCDGVHEYFPDPEDCGKFYQCNGFIPYHMDCPAGLEWSVTRNRCEWPWIAGCSGSFTPQPRPRPTGQPEPSPTSSDGPKPLPTLEPRYNPCDGVHEYFPDPEDCGKFYQCNGFIPYHMDCPAGLEWSVTRNRCEWPWIAGCSGSFTPQPGPRSTGQPAPSPTSSDGPQPAPEYNPCDGVHEFFPDPEDCGKFYHCDGFIAYHKDCPSGLEWSVRRNRCEWPFIAGCSV